MLTDLHETAKFLHAAIHKNNRKNFDYCIKEISESTENDLNLTILDNEGKSFLFHGLEANNTEFAKEILELQQNEDAIIFGKTKKNETLFYIAAAKGNLEILQMLFEKAEAKGKISYFLSQADNDKSTPLHQAALNGHDEVVKWLLSQINAQKLSIISKADKLGNTPLHNAYKLPGTNSISYLLNARANFKKTNNENVPALTLFLELSTDRQAEIFATLNDEVKQELLSLVLPHYRDALIKDLTNEKLKEMYFLLAGLHSLKMLLLAQHEFNLKISERNSYLKSVRIDEDNTKERNYLERKEVHEIIPDVLDKMPLYKARLTKQPSSDANLANPNSNLFDLPNENETDEDEIDFDREVLSKLIKDIETFITDTQTKSPSFYNRFCGKSIPILSWGSYLSTEAWLTYNAITGEKDIHPDDGKPTNIYVPLAILGGFIGALLAGGAHLISSHAYLPKDILISSQNWKELNERIEVIISLLQEIEINQPQNDEENALPFAPEILNTLKSNFTKALKSNMFCGGEEHKSKIIKLFKEQQQLKIVQERVNITGISLFAKSKVAENDEEMTQGNDDEIPLLFHKKT